MAPKEAAGQRPPATGAAQQALAEEKQLEELLTGLGTSQESLEAVHSKLARELEALEAANVYAVLGGTGLINSVMDMLSRASNGLDSLYDWLEAFHARLQKMRGDVSTIEAWNNLLEVQSTNNRRLLQRTEELLRATSLDEATVQLIRAGPLQGPAATGTVSAAWTLHRRLSQLLPPNETTPAPAPGPSGPDAPALPASLLSMRVAQEARLRFRALQQEFLERTTVAVDAAVRGVAQVQGPAGARLPRLVAVLGSFKDAVDVMGAMSPAQARQLEGLCLQQMNALLLAAAQEAAAPLLALAAELRAPGQPVGASLLPAPDRPSPSRSGSSLSGASLGSDAGVSGANGQPAGDQARAALASAAPVRLLYDCLRKVIPMARVAYLELTAAFDRQPAAGAAEARGPGAGAENKAPGQEGGATGTGGATEGDGAAGATAAVAATSAGMLRQNFLLKGLDAVLAQCVREIAEVDFMTGPGMLAVLGAWAADVASAGSEGAGVAGAEDPGVSGIVALLARTAEAVAGAVEAQLQAHEANVLRSPTSKAVKSVHVLYATQALPQVLHAAHVASQRAAEVLSTLRPPPHLRRASPAPGHPARGPRPQVVVRAVSTSTQGQLLGQKAASEAEPDTQNGAEVGLGELAAMAASLLQPPPGKASRGLLSAVLYSDAGGPDGPVRLSWTAVDASVPLSVGARAAAAAGAGAGPGAALASSLATLAATTSWERVRDCLVARLSAACLNAVEAASRGADHGVHAMRVRVENYAAVADGLAALMRAIGRGDVPVVGKVAGLTTSAVGMGVKAYVGVLMSRAGLDALDSHVDAIESLVPKVGEEEVRYHLGTSREDTRVVVAGVFKGLDARLATVRNKLARHKGRSSPGLQARVWDAFQSHLVARYARLEQLCSACYGEAARPSAAELRELIKAAQ